MDLSSNWAYRKHHQIKINKRKEVFLRAKGMCERESCYKEVEMNSEIHHIIPVRFGGNEELNNLAILCQKCHDEISQKAQRVLVWIERHERMLLENRNLDIKRRIRIERDLPYLKKNFLNEFKFKNGI